MNRTNIEYLDYTWNPLAMRCTPVSEGCEHCWHIRMAKRLAGNDRFPNHIQEAYAGDHEPVLIEDRLEEPLRLRKPSRIGVQFMGDLFHEDVSFNTIARVFGVMENSMQRTYIVLTKRADRMLEFTNWWRYELPQVVEPPSGNIWLGVTAENQKRADERIPLLLQCPAAVRFVSIEPILGPIQFKPSWLTDYDYSGGRKVVAPALDWIVSGGESGPGARPAHPDWFRGVRDQCASAGVPFFMKRVSGGQDTPADLAIREWPGGNQ